MAERPGPETLAAWRALLGSYHLVRERLSLELERERGLPLTWYEILLRLDRAPERRLRMRELAAGALISKSGLTQAVTAMERQGLVTREPDPCDRRGTWAVLTPAGRRAFRRAAAVHLRGIQRHFACHLDERQAAVIAEVLTAVGQAAASPERWSLWEQATRP